MEQVKLSEATTESDLLEEVVRRIRACGNPIKIIVFGSRARGDTNSESDFDILVVEESDLPRHRRGIPYYQALKDLGPSRDIVVWTPEEVAEWSAVRHAFITTAVREGVVLYV